ncbi:hypothetical protein H0264_32355 [Nocardia huaxiensis]|uniref:Integral membrane protein n=1 Tax=Nocardia huaxiensis TaxID=2755382 RepID=A0A7D6VCW2_9NOCA|nr:hypothetical protein [Nocardia huaxiensis]QLY29857.1 hypothetical protein H0264_32355 [Nocardia huaxiensis]
MTGFRRWLDEDVIANGRLPLACLLIGFIVGFLLIRISVRLIRKQVRWWPGNVCAGDVHIHHMVFGVILVLSSGAGLVTMYESSLPVICGLAVFFGLGAALVLDEFALIYYLRDVYWEEQGRTSVDAVFVAIAVTGLLLLGFHPLWLLDINDFRSDPNPAERIVIAVFAFVNLGLAAIVIAKGKIWTGLFGMFFPPLLVVGALRLSRPGAPWARWRYGNRRGRMQRAIRRERRYRRPVIRAKIFVQDLLAGKPDVIHVRRAAEEELARTVVPAPPAPLPPPGSVADRLLTHSRADRQDE